MDAQSKSKWGVRKDRTPEELNALCNESFKNLVVPAEWKFEAWDICETSPNPSKEGDNTAQEQVILSVGKIYLDTRTRGIDVKRYRVYFHTYSERMGLVERAVKDYGKFAYRCLINNQTVEKLNEFIRNLPFKPPTAEHDQVYDKNDGLQHFRDRFGD